MRSKAALLQLGLFFLIGCSSITAPSRDPDYAGEIVEVGLHLGGTGPSDSSYITKIWVKAPTEECGIIAHVAKSTRLRPIGTPTWMRTV